MAGSVDMAATGGRSGNSLLNIRAVQLCEAKQRTCPGTQTWLAPQAIVAKNVAENIFKFGGTTITCSEVEWKGKISSTSLFFVDGQFENVEFNGCTSSCVLSAVSGWSFRFANTMANEADGWFGIFLPVIQILCATPLVSCTFQLDLQTYAPFDAYGGTPAMLNSTPHHLLKKTGTCADGTWESSAGGGLLKYEVTAPGKLFVTGTGS